MHYMLHLTYESFVQYGSSNLKALELTPFFNVPQSEKK